MLCIHIYVEVYIPVCVLSTQSYPTLCDPIDCSPPGSSIHGISQARKLYVYVCVYIYTTTTTKSLQSCPTLRDPIDGSPPGSPVPGILQARTLEWVAISFSNAWKWKVKVKLLSHVQPSVTPWTAAYQAPLSMGFSRQEYCMCMYVYTYIDTHHFHEFQGKLCMFCFSNSVSQTKQVRMKVIHFVGKSFHFAYIKEKLNYYVFHESWLTILLLELSPTSTVVKSPTC